MADAGEDTDEALMLRFGEGNAPAFEVLYARHKGPLFRYFRRQSDEAHAEELFQEVWMRVIKARGNYTVEAKFTTWLYRIAHNRLVDHYRASGKRLEQSLDQLESDPSSEEARTTEHEPLLADAPSARPDEAAFRQQQLASFGAALDALPPEQREAFILREDGGLSLDQIAETTGVGRETAKSRLRYAVSRLRKTLEQWS